MPFTPANPMQDNEAFREELLLKQRARKLSLRELAVEVGRSKSWVSDALKKARVEEAISTEAALVARRAARAAEAPIADTLGEPVAAMRVYLHDGQRAIDASGNPMQSAARIGTLRKRVASSDAETSARAKRELDSYQVGRNLSSGFDAIGCLPITLENGEKMGPDMTNQLDVRMATKWITDAGYDPTAVFAQAIADVKAARR